MISKLKAPVASAFLALASLAFSGAAANAAYPMQCRGGGQMIANYYPTQGYIEVHFLKASQGANNGAPGPGQCAWMDRPINAQEPFWFRVMLPGNQRIQRVTLGPGSSQALGSQRVPVTVRGHAVAIIMEVNGNTLSHLINAIDSGQTFSMQAGGSGHNYFNATQLLFQ